MEIKHLELLAVTNLAVQPRLVIGYGVLTLIWGKIEHPLRGLLDHLIRTVVLVTRAVKQTASEAMTSAPVYPLISRSVQVQVIRL